MRFHGLRHTVISEMGAAGFPDSSLNAIAGWMPAKKSERYSHTHIEAKRDVVDKIPRRRQR